MQAKFDKSYYDRFYRDPETRAVSPAAVRRQASFLATYLKYLELPVKSVLDVGCGTGVLLRALQKLYPRARVDGVEYSEYLCRAYGWANGSVIDYQPQHSADLVVCNDVLSYLDDEDCARAIDNLATFTGSALFLGVLTEEDVMLCDRSRTDCTQITRSVSWYQQHLASHFVAVGGGLYLKQPLNVTVWQLERI
jgi:SAM-dependent methyltransferase